MPEQVLLELLRGRGAHTDAVQCLTGLTAAQAAQKVPLSPHTVWSLVGHMNFWMAYEVARIGGTPPPYPAQAALSWPPVPPSPTEGAWTSLTSEFVRLLEGLESVARDERGLNREVPPVHATEQGVDRSVRGVLFQMVAHNSYHLGQVALLRRAVGAWPPPGGSDTW
jgi:hypothetical protein